MKNGLYKKIYLLTGSQDYMKKRAIKAITGMYVSQDDTMNLSYFHGKKVDIKEVLDIANTMPFLAEKRVIVLEDTGLFSKSCEELADFIPVMPESCCMIFSEEKADMRLKQTKAVKAEGCIAEFGNLSDDELRDWVAKKLAREHRPITQKALDTFLSRCGNDMWEISNDLEKLVSYTFGKDGIRIEDIDAVCPPPPEDKIFAMIDAILAGDAQKALSYYTDLLALRSDAMGILKLLREQLRLLLHAKQLEMEHMAPRDMAALLGMREGRIKMALPAARKSSTISLTRRIEMCADTDWRIKSGLIGDQLGIETLIVEMTRKTV